jgi:hypothetical protein
MLAPDLEELVCEYLSPLGNVSVELPPVGDPDNPISFPFYLVLRLTGGDDMVTDYGTVSIQAFAGTRTAASDAARLMHNRMTNLTAKIPITVGGQFVNVDYVETLESPHWEDYGDNTIQRYCARYRIDTRLKTT